MTGGHLAWMIALRLCAVQAEVRLGRAESRVGHRVANFASSTSRACL